MAGLSKAINNSVLGLFLEYGSGNYDTNNSFGVDTVKGKGSISYLGGGVLGKVSNADNYYFDFSGRLGQVKTDFNSEDYVFSGVSAKYNYDVPYYGGHIGAGYIGQKFDNVGLDIYGKYLFTHQNGKEVSLPNGETINFEANNSHRLRFGVKIMRNQKSVFNPYAGAAYDYEFAGEANATVQGLDVVAPSLKGGTAIGELGLQINGGYLSADLGAQGYSGKRKGISGSFKLNYKF
jgi:outer membrane autotransporter protein